MPAWCQNCREALGSPQWLYFWREVDQHLRNAIRKGFLRRRYLLEIDLRFRVGLLSFIDGGVIGYLVRGEPNILRVLMTGDPRGPGSVPVETLSKANADALSSQASEAVDNMTYSFPGPSFSSLYITPAVADEIFNVAAKAALKTFPKVSSIEEVNLALWKRMNVERTTDLNLALAFCTLESVRGVAVGYHQPDIFESCWSGSFLNRVASQPDTAEFPGGWSLAVPIDWIGLSLSDRSRTIAAAILAWAQSTEPPKLSKSELQKIQAQT